MLEIRMESPGVTVQGLGLKQDGRDATARPEWRTISSMLTELLNGH